MATPHIQAEKGDFAKTVLMPGDPLRAKFIADNFLEDFHLVTEVRNILGYTGTYKGVPVSVMASGMGIPSIGIYSYELYTAFDVENIIRIGSAGSYDAELAVNDVVLASAAWSQSTYAKTNSGYDKDTTYPSEALNDKILKAAEINNIPIKTALIHSTDAFYTQPGMDDYKALNQKYGVKCVEMESFGLFHNAAVTGKNAACLVTISDSFVTGEALNAEDRQKTFKNMMKAALESCLL